MVRTAVNLAQSIVRKSIKHRAYTLYKTPDCVKELPSKEALKESDITGDVTIVNKRV